MAAVAAAGVPSIAAARAERSKGAPIRLAMIEAFSGPFANTGDAVARNLTFAIERINARGGITLPSGRRPLQLLTLDSKGQVEEALVMFRRAMDQDIEFVLQGNSSAVAAALIDAVNRHNERNPHERTLFLNYSAVDPSSKVTPMRSGRCVTPRTLAGTRTSTPAARPSCRTTRVTRLWS